MRAEHRDSIDSMTSARMTRSSRANARSSAGDSPSKRRFALVGFCGLVASSIIAPALSLGTSDDAAAVKPLCECLDDGTESESVRVACAAALGKLKKSGSDKCLKSHASDSSAKVREQVGTSLKALGSGVPAEVDECPAGPAGAKAKYYVAVTISNKTGRPDAEIRAMLMREARCKLISFGRFRVAPEDGSDTAKMEAVVKKEKLEGYLLAVIVDPFKYDSGNLKISLRSTLMTHTRDIKALVDKSLTMPGVGSPSKSSEDELLKAGMQRLVTDFAGIKP
jgi:hypothetical protein